MRLGANEAVIDAVACHLLAASRGCPAAHVGHAHDSAAARLLRRHGRSPAAFAGLMGGCRAEAVIPSTAANRRESELELKKKRLGLMPRRDATLLGTLEGFPGVLSLIAYSCLKLGDRHACRLVCKGLRAAIDGSTTHVSIILHQTSTVEDSVDRFARSSLRPNALSLSGPLNNNDADCAEVSSELSSALSILSALKHLAALQAADDSSLAACTQLTRLECTDSFPSLSRLTQLRSVVMYNINSLSTITDLASLSHLVQLRLGSLVGADRLTGGMHFIFPSLQRLEVTKVNVTFLAIMDCPQLQHLGIGEGINEDEVVGLVVDSAPSLCACAYGILQHCHHVQLARSPDVTLAAMLAALAPWQPTATTLIHARDGKKLWLDGEKEIDASHLKLLPIDLQSLTFTLVLRRDCTLLSGALYPVATRLTRLRKLELALGCDCREEDLQLLASHAVQGDGLTVSLHRNVTVDFADALQRLSDSAYQWGCGLGPMFTFLR
ncbi:hypothetical protein QJQ45_028271 [Haematococcus lacustris]|nr:hypothetical protein QJQ45_028271 [Haematococcus lacustris]